MTACPDNCSGAHLPANIAPWAENGIIIGEPADDLSIHSNAVFAAVNFVRAWEADPDPSFARSIGESLSVQRSTIRKVDVFPWILSD